MTESKKKKEKDSLVYCSLLLSTAFMSEIGVVIQCYSCYMIMFTSKKLITLHVALLNKLRIFYMIERLSADFENHLKAIAVLYDY